MQCARRLGSDATSVAMPLVPNECEELWRIFSERTVAGESSGESAAYVIVQTSFAMETFLLGRCSSPDLPEVPTAAAWPWIQYTTVVGA